MIIRTTKRNGGHFTQIENLTLRDERLSYSARGLLNYMLSNKDDWKFTEYDLVSKSPDGRAKVRTAIKELIDKGYLKKQQERGERGRFTTYVYTIYEKSDIWDEPF